WSFSAAAQSFGERFFSVLSIAQFGCSRGPEVAGAAVGISQQIDDATIVGDCSAVRLRVALLNNPLLLWVIEKLNFQDGVNLCKVGRHTTWPGWDLMLKIEECRASDSHADSVPITHVLKGVCVFGGWELGQKGLADFSDLRDEYTVGGTSRMGDFGNLGAPVRAFSPQNQVEVIIRLVLEGGQQSRHRENFEFLRLVA